MPALTALQSNLIVTGVNTPDFKVFWKGDEVPGVLSVKVNAEAGEQQVKLRVNGTADTLYMDMVSAGIIVKKGR